MHARTSSVRVVGLIVMMAVSALDAQQVMPRALSAAPPPAAARSHSSRASAVDSTRRPAWQRYALRGAVLGLVTGVVLVVALPCDEDCRTGDAGKAGRLAGLPLAVGVGVLIGAGVGAIADAIDAHRLRRHGYRGDVGRDRIFVRAP